MTRPLELGEIEIAGLVFVPWSPFGNCPGLACVLPGACFRMRPFNVDLSQWQAESGDENWGASFVGTRAACVAWIETQVAALRAALADPAEVRALRGVAEKAAELVRQARTHGQWPASKHEEDAGECAFCWHGAHVDPDEGDRSCPWSAFVREVEALTALASGREGTGTKS